MSHLDQKWVRMGKMILERSPNTFSHGHSEGTEMIESDRSSVPEESGTWLSDDKLLFFLLINYLFIWLLT
jgi:hypothetical protein